MVEQARCPHCKETISRFFGGDSLYHHLFVETDSCYTCTVSGYCCVRAIDALPLEDEEDLPLEMV